MGPLRPRGDCASARADGCGSPIPSLRIWAWRGVGGWSASKWADLEIVQLSRNADGKLVVLAGYYGASTVLYRYSAQGLVDPSFGSGGQVSRPNATQGA
jgi:hypothetical protein